jgi:hypothetical protein
MAISTNTALNFNSSTGYTIFETNPGDVVFTAGGATLSSGTKSAAVRTPDVDSSSFVSILSAVATTTEAVGFTFRFLVSFDDWSLDTVRQRYLTWIAGTGWQEVADFSFPVANLLAAAQAYGILKVDLSEIRDWPPVGTGSRLSFLVWMDRAASGGNAVGEFGQQGSVVHSGSLLRPARGAVGVDRDSIGRRLGRSSVGLFFWSIFGPKWQNYLCTSRFNFEHLKNLYIRLRGNTKLFLIF